MAFFQRKIFGFGVLLAAVATCGCRASPWSADGTTPQSPAAQAPAATRPTPPLPEVDGQGRPADGDLQQVMAEVRRLGAGNPALQAQLLDELQASEPSLWPLVIESCRARLAYGRQLRQQEALAAWGPREAVPGASAGLRRAQSSRLPSSDSGSQGDSPIHASPSGYAESGQSPPHDASPRVARLPATDSATLVPGQAIYPQGQEHAGQPGQSNEPTANQTAPAAPQDFAHAAGGVVPISYDARDDDWHAPLAQAIALLDAQLDGASPGQEAQADRVKLRLLQWAAEPSRRSTDPLGEASHRLKRVSAVLADAAPLVVRNLAFCRAVQSYGSIKRFEKYEFSPGQRLLLYAEVENFGSQQTPRGYHTSLRSSYQIFDGAAARVACQKSTTTEEYCLNRRRDYFLGCDFRLPGTLHPGRHTLVLSVEDLKTGKVGKASIEFAVR